MTTSLKERLRTLTEAANERERGLPDRKSANVSKYQQEIITRMVHGHGNPLDVPATLVTIHGGHRQELARVLEAYAQLLRSNVESVEP